MLRNVLTDSRNANAFDSEELKDVMDLCLSCKGCKSECPSNVDVAKMKAEALQQYYDVHGVPFRARLIANMSKSYALASCFATISRAVMGNAFIASIIKKVIGFAPERALPLPAKQPLRQWFKQRSANIKNPNGRKVYLFCDEFTNYTDVEVGQKLVLLLEALGYEVAIPEHCESGRASLSKGLLRQARKCASKNVSLLADVIDEETPLIGIEPSAILTFRDEYPDLLRGEEAERARKLSKHCLLSDEFLARELDAGRINADSFTNTKKDILVHGHCYQKALASLVPMKRILELPKHYQVRMIPSGCCGMAGSFGYEAEHYELSMQIGELVLFPAVRKAAEDTIIAAAGTSCRHQITDGTAKKALHPVEILYAALC